MRERIKQVFEVILDLNNVPDDISQDTCVEWDSMHHLQLVVALESEFNISFEPEDIGSMKSLKKIEEKINSLIK